MKLINFLYWKLYKWPFKDPPNTIVLVNSAVLENKSDIIYVEHILDEGFWWSFFSDDDFSDNITTTLQDLVNIDKSLIKLINLPLGYSASRNQKNEHWKIEKLGD